MRRILDNGDSLLLALKVDGLHSKECGWPLGGEDDPQLTADKVVGPTTTRN